jgi:hypothetical protein
MGDRGNIVVLMDTESAPVYLYTHWGGTELPEVVSAALAKRWRWNDPAYLARILFDQLTENVHGQETGFGISTSPCDNEHDYIVVDPLKQEVRVIKYDWEARNENPLAGEVKQFFTFEEVAQSSERLARSFE